MSDPKSYVSTHLNPTLTPALVALCRERPADPVTWLAEYLLAHKPSPPVTQVVADPEALLEQLLADSQTPCALPVLTHARRLQSGLRGVGFSLLRALYTFYDKRGALNKTMEQVCREPGFGVQALTASTGLSLAESVVRAGQRDGVDTSALVGDATAFFSYSWTGTKLGDMLDAVERGIQRLEAEAGGEGRVLVWIDMFCASQNLLGGVYRDDANHPKGSPGYKARKEDTDHIFDDALDAVSVVIFYLSPLEGEWKAPPHPYLADDRGEPLAGWIRHGPNAVTRAWCLFELATALAAGKRLLVELAPADRARLRDILETDPESLDQTLADIDAAEAQISKVEDREYILPRVYEAGGFHGVNRQVKAALRDWLAETGRELLRTAPALVLVHGGAHCLCGRGTHRDLAFRLALATGGAAPRSAPLLEIGTEMTERRSEAGASAG